jgi:hypothetical protein
MNDLVSCPQCARNNAVRRTHCLYCGEALPVTEATSSVQVPTLRTVEDWEQGFTIVLAPLDSESASEAQVARLCEVARFEEEIAVEALGARVPVPVARVPQLSDAELVVRLLGASDLGATIVADKDLAMGAIARRVRAVHFEANRLRLDVLWGDGAAIGRGDIVCAVEGRVVTSTVEILESTGKSRRGHRELVDTSEFFAERFVIDLYGPTLDESYRIKADAFDYGCLGERPAPTLETNFARLRDALATFVGQSRYDRDFVRLSRIVDRAWPASSRVSSRGIARRGTSVKKYSASVIERDAHTQFDRYSRMRYVTKRG